MVPVARSWPFLARALALAVLTGPLLLTPVPVSSQGSGSVDAADYVVWRNQFGAGQATLALRLHLKVAPDGTADLHGAIRLRDEDGRQTLVARGGEQLGVADADGDGVEGLTFLAADFRDGRRQRSVHVELRPLDGQDIDASGVYRVALAIDETTTTTEVHARVA